MAPLPVLKHEASCFRSREVSFLHVVSPPFSTPPVSTLVFTENPEKRSSRFGDSRLSK